MVNFLTLTHFTLIKFSYNLIIFGINASSFEQLFFLKKLSMNYALYSVFKTSLKLRSV